MAKGTLNALIVIPAGFSRHVRVSQTGLDASDRKRRLADLFRGRSLDSGAIRCRAQSGPVVGSDGCAISGRLRGLGAEAHAVARRAAATSSPLAVRDVSAATKELDQKSFFAAGMAVFFLFFTVQFGVMSLLEERNDGTLARLLAAPISRGSILAAKLITSFLLGVISMVVLVAATSVLFGASWGNPLGVAILVVAATLSAIGIMALIATVAKNRGTGEQLAIGGCGRPRTPWRNVLSHLSAPGILSKLTFLAPQAWFLRGLGDLRGVSTRSCGYQLSRCSASPWSPVASRSPVCGVLRRCDESGLDRHVEPPADVCARTNIFFVFVFPMILILVLGATFGGSSNPHLGIVGGRSGPLAEGLLKQLEETPHIKIVSVPNASRLLTQVERGNLAAGLHPLRL